MKVTANPNSKFDTYSIYNEIPNTSWLLLKILLGKTYDGGGGGGFVTYK